MLKHQSIKSLAARRAAIAALLGVSLAAPAGAQARVAQNQQAPSVEIAAISSLAPQAREAQSSAGFDWGDAGIGAAIAVALGGAGSAALAGRRRGTHQTATS